MDELIAKTGGGIILAALSGITFIAYNHPRAYSKLALFLFGFLALLYVSRATTLWRVIDPRLFEDDHHAAPVEVAVVKLHIARDRRAVERPLGSERHLTSARTYRAFRASALQTWREGVAAA